MYTHASHSSWSTSENRWVGSCIHTHITLIVEYIRKQVSRLMYTHTHHAHRGYIRKQVSRLMYTHTHTHTSRSLWCTSGNRWVGSCIHTHNTLIVEYIRKQVSRLMYTHTHTSRSLWSTSENRWVGSCIHTHITLIVEYIRKQVSRLMYTHTHHAHCGVHQKTGDVIVD